MSSYIKSYKLLNFQSWNKSSAEIPLETDMVNIIEGANETGKSVLYKVLYNFCFPGYWAPTELIRRGCEAGVLLLQLEDDAIIMYALKRNSYTYVLIEPDGTKTEWTNQGCPDEIVDRLGLILDKETRVVLNIIDSDVALPFIKTTPAFNASLIRSIVEPEGMTKFFQNLADTTIKVDNAQNFFGSKAATLQEQLVHIPVIDPIQMENQKALVDYLATLAESFNSVETKVSDLFDCLRTVITVVEDPSIVEEAIQLYDMLNMSIDKCSTLLGVLLEEIPIVQSPACIDDSLDILNALEMIIKNCADLYSLYIQTPIEVASVDIDYDLNTLESLQRLCNSLDTFSSILSAEIPQIEFTDMADSIDLLQSIDTCIKDSDALYLAIDEDTSSREKLTSLKSELDAIINEIGVCPTCGQLLGGQHDSCIHNT